MNNTVSHLLTFAFTMQTGMEVNTEEWKKRILVKWEESKKMPRKMKKRVRKELQLEWNIACWNPFEDLNF